MTREYFESLVDKFRSPHIWKLNNDKWVLRKNCWTESNSTPNNIDSASEWSGNNYFKDNQFKKK